MAAPAVDVHVDEARGDERAAGRRLVRLVGLDRRDPAVLDRDPAGNHAVDKHQAAGDHLGHHGSPPSAGVASSTSNSTSSAYRSAG